mgnify:CR=1 FL=1
MFKVESLFCWLLFIACLILLVLYFKKDNALVQSNEENSSLQRELLSLHYQLLADEAIVSGQTKRAKNYLQTIDSLQPDAERFVKSRLRFLENLMRDSLQYAGKLRRLSEQNKRELSRLHLLMAKSDQEHQTESEALLRSLQLAMLLQADLEDSLLRLNTAFQRELNGHQLLTFLNKANRVLYVGEVKDSMANGRGSGLWQTGGLYTGEWLNNLRHGYGKYRWADGESYEGHFTNDRRNGLGTYHWKNGDSYTGEWLDDRRNGYGELRNAAAKLISKGQWKDDQLIISERAD